LIWGILGPLDLQLLAFGGRRSCVGGEEDVVDTFEHILIGRVEGSDVLGEEVVG